MESPKHSIMIELPSANQFAACVQRCGIAKILLIAFWTESILSNTTSEAPFPGHDDARYLRRTSATSTGCHLPPPVPPADAG